MAQEQDRQHPFLIEPLAVSIIVLLFSLFPLLSARAAPAMAAILCIIALLACARRWKNVAPLAIFCAACALLASWAAHVGADIVIVGVVLMMSRS